MVKTVLTDFEELKSKMKSLMIEAETKVLEGKDIPTKYQEIPALFEGWDEKASKAIRGAMWISKKYNLIPFHNDFITNCYQKVRICKILL